jgi:hypothetical protein
MQNMGETAATGGGSRGLRKGVQIGGGIGERSAAGWLGCDGKRKSGEGTPRYAGGRRLQKLGETAATRGGSQGVL